MVPLTITGLDRAAKVRRPGIFDGEELKTEVFSGENVSTTTAVIVGLILLIAAAAGLKAKGKSGATTENPKRKQPLTKHEAAMYNRLTQALPERVVLAQVSFGALLTARSKGARNRFDRKIADFVICDRAMQVIAVIELDDSSHRGKEDLDSERDRLLEGAGYRVIRYPRVPDVEKVKEDFASQATEAGASKLPRIRAV